MIFWNSLKPDVFDTLVGVLQTKDIEKLAALVRLKLSPEEAERFARDAEAILSYVSALPEALGGEVVANIRLSNVMREDGEPYPSGVHTDDLLREVPKTDKGYVSVKPILSKDL